MRPEFVARTFRAYLVISGLTFLITMALAAPKFIEAVPAGGWILAAVTLVYVPYQVWIHVRCGGWHRTSGGERKLRSFVFRILLRDSVFLCLLCWSAGTYKSVVSMFILIPLLIAILLLDRARIRWIAVLTSLLFAAIVLLETAGVIPHVEWSLEYVNIHANPWNAVPLIAIVVCSIFVVYSVALAVLDELTEKRMELEAMASRDTLTGLYNRRVFDLSAARELERSVRTGQPLTFVLVDVDYFKKVNDTYGHGAGDAVLRKVAAVFESSLRRGADWAFRFGGDEFVLLLTETGAEGALVILERILERFRTEEFTSEKGRFGVTLSFGGYSLRASETLADLDYCLERADQSLYRAKQKGRNCVVLDEDAVQAATVES